jgi:hypothetical protein
MQRQVCWLEDEDVSVWRRQRWLPGRWSVPWGLPHESTVSSACTLVHVAHAAALIALLGSRWAPQVGQRREIQG